MSFLEQMKAKARTAKQRIILPEATDRRVLTAAAAALAEELAEIVLIGNPDAIAAGGTGLDLSRAVIIDPLTAPQRLSYTEALFTLRQAKGLTREAAADLLQDPVYFGMMMLQQGDADGLVSGAIHSTADTLRPALQIVKTAPGASMVSTFFVMVVPDCSLGANGTFIFADCALNENPTAPQLAEIAVASADTMRQLLGITPLVAMLSYSTLGSANSAMTSKVVEATTLAKQQRPDLQLDGELQLDAALIHTVASLKAPGSPVAGQANVLVFPDLNAGNIGYKLTERLAKAQAYGPITQGLAKPINDLSRGCKAEDIVGVIAITAVQAQK